MRAIKEIAGGAGVGSAVLLVSTTNATVTTIDTVPIPTSKAIMIKAKVVGIKDDFSAKGGFEVEAIYANNAGTVTLQGIVNNIHKQAAAGWNVTFVISSTNVLIRVTGAAATNISWKSLRTTILV